MQHGQARMHRLLLIVIPHNPIQLQFHQPSPGDYCSLSFRFILAEFWNRRALVYSSMAGP